MQKIKINKNIFLKAFVFVFVSVNFFFIGEAKAATVVTSVASQDTTNATIMGIVTGGSSVDEWGIMTSPQAIIAPDSSTAPSIAHSVASGPYTDNGSFSVVMANTSTHFMAYVHDAAGYYYGNDIATTVFVDGACSSANGKAFTAAAFEPLRVWGDPTGDGNITAGERQNGIDIVKGDGLEALHSAVGDTSICTLATCDVAPLVNGVSVPDGIIDISDALVILRAAMGMSPGSPLCATGIETGVTGTGPWSWSCVGTGGGETANCSASLSSATTLFGDTDVNFKNVTHGETDSEIVKINFSNISNATQYMISKNKDFSGEQWETIVSGVKIKLNNNQKKTFYIKFRAANGVESDVFSKSITYSSDVANELKNSDHFVSRGDLLIQSGRHFSKNSNIALHFSKANGSYYAPVIVKTDSKGSFKVTYKVNKPAGYYSWFATDLKTGKDSKMQKYVVQ